MTDPFSPQRRRNSRKKVQKNAKKRRQKIPQKATKSAKRTSRLTSLASHYANSPSLASAIIIRRCWHLLSLHIRLNCLPMPFPNPRPLDVPIIETERLKLRGHTIEDASNVTALWSNADVTRYIGGKPHTAEECWARLLRYAGHWSLLGFGYWAVEEKAAGEFVGEVGFSNSKREIEPPLGAVEVGVSGQKHCQILSCDLSDEANVRL
jgi:hypothetical protein